jgi:hypothetical protein
MSEKKPNLKKFELLLAFMKGDSRVLDAYRWSLSIKTKGIAIEILYREVLTQIKKCFEELEDINKKGYGSYINFLILAIKYEVFLNSIYALCENLSRIVYYLYPTKNLSPRFREQKEKFLEDFSIDSDYSKILSGSNWYDEVHGMRSEATHFLSGLISFSSPIELGYFNIPKSTRKEALKKISIDDISKHATQIYNDVLQFLSLYGNHFIAIINQDSRVAMTCLRTSSELLGVRYISLREYLNGESGICHTKKLDCPKKDSCEARKKSGN